jgi:thiol-disulfide isomerase/thioredoxin
LLNLSLIDGEIKGLDGKTVKLSSFAGSVVILDYWATWCGPCKMSFPSLQKLYDKYKGNPKVKFAIVNVWEKDADRFKLVKDFLASNPSYKFPMYVDEFLSMVLPVFQQSSTLVWMERFSLRKLDSYQRSSFLKKQQIR